MLFRSFSATLRFDPNVATQLPKKVYHSIQDALVYAESTSGELGQVVQTESKVAFEAAHSAVLIACSLILLLFTIQMSIKWYKDKKHNHFKIDK